jgi:flagellar hook-associated protein 3 FlgL
VRITNQMMTTSLMANLNASRSRSADLAQQISSGERITKVSDDLAAGGEVMRLQGRVQVVDQWTKNIHDAQDWTNANESALGHMNEILQRAKEMAIQAGNNSGNIATSALAQEATQLYDEMASTLNRTGPNGFLFGGFKTEAPAPVPPAVAYVPFDTSAGAPVYQGDAGAMQRDVGPGVALTVNISGNQFTPAVVPPATPIPDPLTTLYKLTQDLQNGSLSGIQADMGNLDSSMKTVSNLRSLNGARVQRLEQLEAQLKDSSLNLLTALDKTQGTDMEKAIMELNNQDISYRAALQVGARIIPPSLADFLR